MIYTQIETISWTELILNILLIYLCVQVPAQYRYEYVTSQVWRLSG